MHRHFKIVIKSAGRLAPHSDGDCIQEKASEESWEDSSAGIVCRTAPDPRSRPRRSHCESYGAPLSVLHAAAGRWGRHPAQSRVSA
jgi:hypothetical protein